MENKTYKVTPKDFGMEEKYEILDWLSISNSNSFSMAEFLKDYYNEIFAEFREDMDRHIRDLFYNYVRGLDD